MDKIPVSKIAEAESERLMKLEETLHKRVIGQDEAVSSIARAIRRGRVGLKDPDRPIGSFLFLGPTGVGKLNFQKLLQMQCLEARKHLYELICLNLWKSIQSQSS